MVARAAFGQGAIVFDTSSGSGSSLPGPMALPLFPTVTSTNSPIPLLPFRPVSISTPAITPPTETQPITLRAWDNVGGPIVSWAVQIDQIVFNTGPFFNGPSIVPYSPYSVPNLATMMQLAGTDTGSAP